MVGQVATIITGAVRDVAGAVGGFATELFEIRDSARKAAAVSVVKNGFPVPAANITIRPFSI